MTKTDPQTAWRLLARRGEFIERTFASCYETGGIRRPNVRGDETIATRLLLHAAAFNLSLVVRKLFKAGTPRGYGERAAAHCRATSGSGTAIRTTGRICWSPRHQAKHDPPSALPGVFRGPAPAAHIEKRGFAAGRWVLAPLISRHPKSRQSSSGIGRPPSVTIGVGRPWGLIQWLFRSMSRWRKTVAARSWGRTRPSLTP